MVEVEVVRRTEKKRFQSIKLFSLFHKAAPHDRRDDRGFWEGKKVVKEFMFI
jgi:hypothetical protein